VVILNAYGFRTWGFSESQGVGSKRILDGLCGFSGWMVFGADGNDGYGDELLNYIEFQQF